MPVRYLHYLDCRVLSDGRVLCDNCGQSTGNAADMTRHIYAHFDELRFECPACPQTFAREDSVKRHHRNFTHHAYPNKQRVTLLAAFKKLYDTNDMDADDIDVALKLFGKSEHTTFDMERKVLMFANLKTT